MTASIFSSFDPLTLADASLVTVSRVLSEELLLPVAASSCWLSC